MKRITALAAMMVLSSTYTFGATNKIWNTNVVFKLDALEGQYDAVVTQAENTLPGRSEDALIAYGKEMAAEQAELQSVSSESETEESASKAPAPMMPNLLENGLIAYYPFSGNTEDASGNGHDGIPFNVVLTNDSVGRVNSAYHFNGANAEIDCGNLITGLTQYAVCAWVKLTSYTDSYIYNSYYMGPWGQLDLIYLYTGLDDNFGSILDWLDGSVTDTRVTHPLPLNEWHLVTQTYDGAFVRQYDNGDLVNECAASGKTLGNAQPFVIGSTKASPNGYLQKIWFHGCIDELRVYNRNLSASEVSALYSLESTPATLTITATAGFGGSISPEGAITVNYGAATNFAITANTNYHIADVVMDGSSIGVTNAYTFTNVTTNHSIDALFEADPALSVAPDNRSVGAAAGATTFTVSNTGGGTMGYTTGESESWLAITSGGTGSNSGTITVMYNANLVPNARTGTVTVSAPGADGSPTTVTVRQVGHGPDFVVSALQMTPPDPATGRTFTVKATLLNQGTLSGNAGYVSLWVNHPAVAVVNESTPKRSSVGTLTPGQSRIITFTALVAPVQAGTYTLRAFVDSAGRTAEGDESNNQTTLAYQARAPYVDLAVVDVDVAPLWPLPSGLLTTYVTLQNRGNVPSPATRLSVWSNQADAVACGAPGLYKTVTALSPWTPRRETVTGVRAPNAAGDYVLRAFVDSTCALAETTETNNQGALQYTVYNPTPNLTVTKIALSVSRPRAEQTFVATVTVKNIGTGPAAAGRLGVWRDRLTAPGVGDTPDAYVDAVSLLPPGASVSLKVPGLIAPAAGSRTIFVLVDANGDVAELSETDNTLSLPYTVLP